MLKYNRAYLCIQVYVCRVTVMLRVKDEKDGASIGASATVVRLTRRHDVTLPGARHVASTPNMVGKRQFLRTDDRVLVFAHSP